MRYRVPWTLLDPGSLRTGINNGQEKNYVGFILFTA